mmetsp:Transcript_95713/g.143373  ORF Transcript_95713/g.143373 Transcript_95713/m.143373 type:complete len:637 (-) Transcript_95713:292-2202(-)
MNPLAGLERSVGKELLDKIQSSKLLVVGSGGIGCELLKDLALSGFRQVEVIDLDTIDVSNLNRQLLFRSNHVGMAKCTVACQVAQSMVPPTTTQGLAKVVYRAHHGNVCDTSQFHVAFVKRFDLVLNALDNVEARRRVNRLCLAGSVPLIEAGTTGYLGQVTVIHQDLACYECRTQETQKVYPICTIRSTPSMPVHTIVWAKELYKLLCHSSLEESMLYEDEEGEEPSTYMEAVKKVRKLIKAPNTATNSRSDHDQELATAGAALLEALYHTEIQKQLDMGRYKAAKKTPTPLQYSLIEASSAEDNPNRNNTNAIWSIQNCLSEFQHLLQRATAAASTELLEAFDKDDDLAMRFVAAASNLRSHVFGIQPLQSIYSAKGIAGNIIPAIATTNAICAGLQILQAFRVLKAKLSEPAQPLKEACQYINCIRNKTRNGLFLTASALESPNPSCFVCRNAVIPLQINIDQWTLEQFLKTIVKGRLGFEAPTLLLQGDFIWEEGDGADSSEYELNLAKTLSKLPCGGIRNGTVLEIDDATQNLTIQVSVTNQEVWEGDLADLDYPFLVGATPKAAAAPVKPEAVATEKCDDDDDDDIVVVCDDQKEDDVVMLLDSDDEERTNSKRPADSTEGEPVAKKQKK